VARFNHRMAAGVGVLAALLLLGAPTTVAVAHPGGSHSDRGDNSHRGNDRSNGRGGFGRDDNYRGSNDGSRKRDGADDRQVGVAPGIIESPQSRVGSGRGGVADAEEPAPSIAARSAVPEQSQARVSAVDPGDARLSSSEGGEAPSSASAPNVFGGVGAPSQSGSDPAGAPSARVESPPVTLGNGREPVIERRGPEPQWQAPALQPVPAAPPPALPPPAAPAPSLPARVDRAPEAPVLTQRLGLAPATDWSNPLWGLAGLLLIPVAGAVLGYRQARAAHAAERLRRT
jgi:hypothetical protein